MAMVARHMEKRDSVRDEDHDAPSAKLKHPPESGKSPLISPVTGPTEPEQMPFQLPESDWRGIAVDLLKEYGGADPSPTAVRAPIPHVEGDAASRKKPTGIETVKAKDAAKKDALVKEIETMSKEKAEAPPPRQLDHEYAVRQIETLQMLLKQEREARAMAETMVKDLTLETRGLRDELANATTSAATARAALEAREELLTHLKEEVTELRSMFKARAA